MIIATNCPFCDVPKDVDLPINSGNMLEEGTAVARCDTCEKRYLITYRLEMRATTSHIIDAENSNRISGIIRDIHKTVGVSL